ncbi:MAG: DUF2975 domain-containing protein [Clostridiaceae bacterium]|nr:DUF2975 domain-containing protein [Clostridiaceae bacterium]
MAVIDEKGLTGVVKRFIDLVFLGGAGIMLALPFLLKWAFTKKFADDENYYFLVVFFYFTGFFALVIVYELRNIFKALNKRNPFIMENVKSLKRIAYASFIIAFAYFVKIIFFISILTVVMSMLFIIIGLFSIILSEVFHQAVIVKEENDLTI